MIKGFQPVPLNTRMLRSMRNQEFLTCTLLAALAAGGVSEARAGGKAAAARELAEWALRKFTGKAGVEATEVLAKKITSGAARYGDDLVSAALRKAGPKALSLADEAAEISPKLGHAALRFVAKHGDDGGELRQDLAVLRGMIA